MANANKGNKDKGNVNVNATVNTEAASGTVSGATINNPSDVQIIGEGKTRQHKRIHINDLRTNPGNIRRSDNMALGSMEDQIVQARRVLEPLMISPERGNMTIRGNRRLSAAKKLYNDPTCPADLKANLEYLECTVVTGLSDEEVAELTMDQGTQLSLDKAETVEAVWRFQKLYMGDMYRVCNQLYTVLATFTGQLHKATEVQNAKTPEQRKEILLKWLRGTVNDHLFKAATLGPRVRRMLILENIAKTRPLTEAETTELTFSANRANVAKLAKAKEADLDKAKGGKGWNADTGGENFNKVITELEAEFGKEKPKSDRPTVKALTDLAGAFHSPEMQAVLLHCAGEKQPDLSRIDDELYRAKLVREEVLAKLDAIKAKDAKVGNFLVAIFFQGPEKVNETLTAYLA